MADGFELTNITIDRVIKQEEENPTYVMCFNLNKEVDVETEKGQGLMLAIISKFAEQASKEIGNRLSKENKDEE